LDNYFYELRYNNDIHEWRAKMRRALLHTVWQWYGKPLRHNPVRILDIGCGTGVNIVSLGKIGSVWGTDVSSMAVTFCKKRGLRNVIQATAEKMPVRSDRFELISAIDVIEHIHDDDGALKELYRICASRGLLTVVVPAFRFLWSDRDERLQHERRYTTKELKLKIEQAGFTVLKCSYIDTFLFPPLLLLVRLGLLSGKRPTIRMDVAPRLAILDRCWLAAGHLERLLLRWFNFPLGVSVLCVGQKDGNP